VYNTPHILTQKDHCQALNQYKNIKRTYNRFYGTAYRRCEVSSFYILLLWLL